MVMRIRCLLLRRGHLLGTFSEQSYEDRRVVSNTPTITSFSNSSLGVLGFWGDRKSVV